MTEASSFDDFIEFSDFAIPMDGNGSTLLQSQTRHELPSRRAEGYKPLRWALLQKLKDAVATSLTADEAMLMASWIEGKDEFEVAVKLNRSPDAVRATRQKLMQRIHLTIDPPSM